MSKVSQKRLQPTHRPPARPEASGPLKFKIKEYVKDISKRRKFEIKKTRKRRKKLKKLIKKYFNNKSKRKKEEIVEKMKKISSSSPIEKILGSKK